MLGSHSPALLQEVMAAAERLPPFPDVVWKVMPMIRNMAPVREIEEVIKYDQAIAVRVLSMSQAAQYARRRRVTSLHDAIVALGEQQLISVVMTACSARYFKGESSGYDLREGELWEHAVASALMAEMVARKLGRKDVLAIYTSALLHDIGKTVLNLHVDTYFDSILALVQEKKMKFIEAEREVLGIDHEQLGECIARSWRFPEEVCTAIGHHHHPSGDEGQNDLAGLTYVANRMVSALGIGCGVDGFLQPNEDDVFRQLGVTTRMVDQFLADLVEVFAETKQFLSS